MTKTYTLKNPTVEAVHVTAVRDGENCPQWFLEAVFKNKISPSGDGTFIVHGRGIADNTDVILKNPDGLFSIMETQDFWRLYQGIPEAAL